jgi:hypothetical protein
VAKALALELREAMLTVAKALSLAEAQPEGVEDQL